MRYFLFLLLALSASASFAQTAPRKTATKASRAVPRPRPRPAPVLTFQRGACLGPCPAYTLSVFADGTVLYEGQQNVPVLGKKAFKIANVVVAEMLRLAREIHFSALKPLYSNGATDIPATIVAVRQSNGQLKTVTVEDNAPEDLQRLLNYLRSQFDPLAGLKEGR